MPFVVATNATVFFVLVRCVACSLGVWLAHRLTALIDRSSQTLKIMTTTKIKWSRKKTIDRDRQHREEDR